MNACDDRAVDMMRYLDNELGCRKLREFEAHLQNCAYCKTCLAEQLALFATLRQYRPLFSAPTELRARVTAAQALSAPNTTTSYLGKHVTGMLSRISRRSARMIPRLRGAGFAAAGGALCFLLIPSAIREARAADYVTTALATHHSYLTGKLPLAIESDSPQAVTGWLTGKVSFPFRLPISQEEAVGRPTYRLVGARLLKYRKGQAVLVSYKANGNNVISLLVAPSNFAVVDGGFEVRSANLVFHYRSHSGFQIITWSTHGLSYALVSKVAGSVRGSCLTCHQNMTDRGSSKPDITR